MKKISSILIAMLVGVFAFAQQTNPEGKLPVDKSITKGVLPNGMTYYIKKTDVVKDAASYYIIQNVGSILENEGQRGLAHFLEHMAFNGTQHFAGKGILNTLQKHGAVFGKDINAYTAFDETVYNLTNIPTKDGLQDTCLMVLKDWANYLLLTEEEIDAERGVIKEEWRTRDNGRSRLLKKSMPTVFNNAKYAERMPIGLMSVVEGFDYKTLRDFYHDWYRTDLQAIAVIGDVDVPAIEAKIKAMFSEIPAVQNPRERFYVEIPENKGMLYCIGMDAEISTAQAKFAVRHAKPKDYNSVKQFREDFLVSMATTMLNERLSAEAKKADAPFLYSGVSFNGLSRMNNELSAVVVPKKNKQQQAFTAVMTELFRAVKFGFVPSEIERTKKRFSNAYETMIAKKEDMPHSSIERVIQSNFLNNKPMTDIEKEYEIVKNLFATLTPEELHKAFAKLYKKDNRYLSVTGVEGDNNLTEQQAIEIINTVENDASLTPYSEDFAGKTLLGDIKIQSGKIEKEDVNEALGATTFVLSNGVNVHYKFADKEKNKVVLQAISYGGTSLLNEEDLPSSDLVGDLVGMSGLGDYNATELPKVLAGKTAGASVSLGDLTERVFGNSTTKDVETMLQLVYLRFQKPRFDKQAWEVLKGAAENYITRRSKDINAQMQDSLMIAVYGKNNPRNYPFSKDVLGKADFNKMKSIYLDRFANAADFDFYVVGDVKAEVLKPLLEKYIASLSTTGEKENFKDVGNEWVSNKIDEDIFLKMENPKANVNIACELKKAYSPKNQIIASALGAIMQLRVTETLREQEGGVYSPRAYAYLDKIPTSSVVFHSSFDCNPDLVEKLISIEYEELQKIANGEINDDDFNKTMTNFLKEREQAKNKNSYDLRLLKTYFRDGYNMELPENFSEVVKNMTKKDIQDLAKDLLANAKTYEIVFKPKQ